MSFDSSWFDDVMETIFFCSCRNKFVCESALRNTCTYYMQIIPLFFVWQVWMCFVCMSFEAVIIKIMAFCNVMQYPILHELVTSIFEVEDGDRLLLWIFRTYVNLGCNIMALHKRLIFSLSTWYRLHAVLEGCQVSWSQDITEWVSFRVASY
jgi:hypothetical protein